MKSELMELEDLERLVSQGVFRNRDSLLSFCLAWGIFNNRKSERSVPDDYLDNLTVWEIWPLIQIIMSSKHPQVEDMPSMITTLKSYMAGGIGDVRECIGRTSGIEAHRKILELIPP